MRRSPSTFNYFLLRVNKSAGQNIIEFRSVRLCNDIGENVNKKNNFHLRLKKL